jgi:2-dehydro-3-deoxyphosphogluconate aldolase/(4S)-4-hydroxy-2-oxoglutarate aldolase
MQIQHNIAAILNQNPLIPVVKIEQVSEVEGIIQQLVVQNIHCIEITLRSEAAFDCIEAAIKLAPKGFSIGVGTIINAAQVDRCNQLGVGFMVSPGATSSLIGAMQQSGIPFLPGVMTPSEILNAMELGCFFLKLFPYNIAGGIKALKSYGQVFPAVQFCPTGGINAESCQEVLDLDNVVSVGGSWLV